MAVQKHKVSRRKRGHRRAHQKIQKPSLSTDFHTGETHRRHHITADGFYKGQQMVDLYTEVPDEEDEG